MSTEEKEAIKQKNYKKQNKSQENWTTSKGKKAEYAKIQRRQVTPSH
jgi:hypothetical protein